MITQKSLGAKLIASFIAVAVLTLALGGLAVFNMWRVKSTAESLATSKVPAVAVANEVERSSLRTMYETRGYAFTEETGYLEKAKVEMADVLKFLREASDHAAKHELAVLRENAKLATEKATAYGELMNDTVKITEALKQDKQALDVAAAAYMKAAEDFFHNQEATLKTEIGALGSGKLTEDKLQERFQKILIAQQVIDEGNEIRVGAWKAISNRSPDAFRATMKRFDSVNAKLDELRKITRQDLNIAQIAACRAAGQAYLKGMESFLANWLAREEIGARRLKTGDEVLAAAEKTAKFNMEGTVTGTKESAAALSGASNLVLIGCGVTVVLALALGVLITRSITVPIRRVAETLSAGSEQTASASRQVASSSQSLAEGSSEQAASLEETSSSLEEMSSTTQRNADGAQRATALAKEARAAAETGTQDMDAMNSAMRDIKTSSDDVAKIIKTIDEIAFQTNILALNAAVEAARAGEAGMGFAVVADEVRALAQRSAQAAKDTASKIETAIAKTAQGVQISERVATALHNIVGKARQVDELAAEVATASQEQTRSIDQLNQAVGQMDKVTQSTAANAEESAGAAEELTAQAASLQEAVQELLALVDGAKATHGSRGPAIDWTEPAAGAAARKPAKAAKAARISAGHPPVKPAGGSHHHDAGANGAPQRVEPQHAGATEHFADA